MDAELAAVHARTVEMWEEMIAEMRAGIATVCNFRGSPKKRRKVARDMARAAQEARVELALALFHWEAPEKPQWLAALAEIEAAYRAFA